MTRTLARLLPLLAIVLSLAAFAQTGPALPASPTPGAAAPLATGPAGPTKIGIMNIQGAIVTTNEGQREFQALQTKFTPKSTELEGLRREVDDLKKRLSDTGDKLNEEARGSLVRQIDTKQKTLQREYEDANNELQSQQGEIFNRIGQKMIEVLDKYAKDNGFTVILEYSNQSPGSVLWATPTIDVTRAVIDAYNTASSVPAQVKPSVTPGTIGPRAPAPAGAPKKPAQ
jgi:outer membrane protein